MDISKVVVMNWEMFVFEHPFLFCMTVATVSMSLAIAVYSVVARPNEEVVKDIVSSLVALWLLAGLAYFILVLWG